jgi:hypothetical protein
MYRKSRNLTLTGITIVSAAVLAVLGATGASASTVAAATPGHADTAAAGVHATQARSATPDTTGVLCDQEAPAWTCIQISGSGLYIKYLHAWAHNEDPAGIYGSPYGDLWIELYAVSQNSPPGGPGYHPVGPPNCPFSYLEPNGNSKVCSWGPGWVATGYYCAALWYPQGNGEPPFLVSWQCAYVHP